MGHWSESLVDELAAEIGGSPDRRVLIDVLGQVGRGLEVLSGRTFNPPRRATMVFEPNGLPFVDIPDLQVGSMEPVAGAWPVPDPANPEMAAVLQVTAFDDVARKAASPAYALGIAGLLVAEASRTGRLSKDYVLHWLAGVEHEQRKELMRRVMDPAVRLSVPILRATGNGWWIQISRRLIWVTSETEDDGRLLELLLDEMVTCDEAVPLAAAEPVLIAVPMTRQPAEWAFIARLWPGEVRRSVTQSWSKVASAIHGYGIPVITLDPHSTPYEIACQVLLKGYWHGYIGSDEPALADAVAVAYPRQVERIQRATRALNKASAATTLLEQLIRPGFDPAQGAEATRRYVQSKASIAVKEHRKAEAPGRYPWTQIGISERRYYKLLPRFADKVDGRYVLDYDDVVTRMKDYLDGVERERAVRANALDVLQSRGFGKEAARKWLQRHQPAEALHAWPRRPRWR